MKVCPECKTADHLWRGVTLEGWQAIGPDLKPTGERGVEWTPVYPDGTLGCSECQWEGTELATLGIDGEPLPVIHPQQQALEIA